jgi:acetyl esterase/lipase
MDGMSRRELALGALAGSALITARPLTAFAQAAPSSARDELWYVNPELREMVRSFLPMLRSFKPLSDATLPDMRRRPPLSAPLATPPHEKKSIPGAKGQPDVVIHIVNAKAGARRGGILHTHGGGYVTGDVSSNLAALQATAAALDCCIVSVAYRLAPETTYKGSIEDNYAGLLWLHRNAESLGVDPSRLAVSGESAGGGHAALLAIAARDRGEVPLVLQCLTYPMLDDRTGSTRKLPFPIGELVWNGPSNIYGWRSFLGQEPGGPGVPAAAVPARQANLAGLAPAWIGVGAIDLFVSEDLEYARRLIEAGVPAEVLVVPGAPHGFDAIAGQTSIGKQFNTARLEAFRRAFAG